ncbi:unnamed protein product, partial [Phaeothamnion confervicola]
MTTLRVLDLASNGFTELGSLTALTQLELHTNFLQGSIPYALGKL